MKNVRYKFDVDKNENIRMTNLMSDALLEENILIGKTNEEITSFFNKEPDMINLEEWVYIINTYFFGILTRKLYLFFHKGRVRDFYFN